MTPALRDALASALGVAVRSARAVSGGDINDAYEARLNDGSLVFVKTHSNPPDGMFEAEAEGLRWLAEPDVVRIPEVLACSNDAPAFLALEFLSPAPRVSDFDDQLGRALAELHDFGAPGFGHGRDNFIGRLPLDNAVTRDWPSFYWERRLAPQARLATDRGLLPERTRRKLSSLEAVLPELAGPPEPPARLHGDLWGGNLHTDDAGRPCLIDPAVYGGHREIDLAMMRLFGGFGSRVFDAYEEVHALAEGSERRIPLYQLYPLLVHVNLFGGSYARSVDRVLDACL